MSTTKFSFIAEKQLNKTIGEGGYRVSLYKNGVLAFPSETMRIYELANKYVKIYVDLERKTIGWAVIEGKTSLDDIDDARLMVQRKNGMATLMIGKILRKMGFEKGEAPTGDYDAKVYKSSFIANDIRYITLEKDVSLN